MHLQELTLRLGPQVLSLVCAPRGLDVDVSDVVVFDRSELNHAQAGELYLGAGLGSSTEAVAAINAIGERGGSALVLKADGLAGTSLLEAAQDGGVALLAAASGASWAQLVVLLRSALAQREFAVPG